jgi:hypothetical protein
VTTTDAVTVMEPRGEDRRCAAGTARGCERSRVGGHLPDVDGGGRLDGPRPRKRQVAALGDGFGARSRRVHRLGERLLAELLPALLGDGEPDALDAVRAVRDGRVDSLAGAVDVLDPDGELLACAGARAEDGAGVNLVVVPDVVADRRELVLAEPGRGERVAEPGGVAGQPLAGRRGSWP